ncbi:MAG TPA: helix-turn-helix domain-containing protein, partial [Candidatus Limnocylindria bacterium]|nr:helix-turn-helix domain-containing protein [Candidatus Limnocylindria bacterium]
RAGGNRSKAAEELGIYRRLLYAKLREYGLGD